MSSKINRFGSLACLNSCRMRFALRERRCVRPTHGGRRSWIATSPLATSRGSRSLSSFSSSRSRTTSAISDKRSARHLGQIHPSQLNVGRILGKVVDIQIGYVSLEYSLTIEGQCRALRQEERYRQHRQQAVLDAKRSPAPDIIDFSQRHRPVSIGIQQTRGRPPCRG